MHKIAAKEFTLEDFSTEHLIDDDPTIHNDTEHTACSSGFVIEKIIVDTLNHYRDMYLETKDKKYWWQMIQLLPSSYNQTRNVMLNYEVLANIYKSRKNHKLDEWRVHETPEEHKFRNKDFASGKWGFCDWIESLPYSELITGSESLKNNIEKALGHGVTPNVDIDDLKALTFVPNVAREAVGLKPVIEEKED